MSEKLRALALAATQGPWMHRKLASRPDIPGFVQGPFVDGLPYACEILGDDYTGFGDNDQHEKDCDYVAKANPTNILALLDEIDKLKAENAGLLEALEKALPFMEAESVISGYGFYRPSNPNDFHPDHESCSEDEIAAHKAACESHDAGTYNDNYGGGLVGPGLHILNAPWGIGSYTDTIPELEAQCEKARAAIASARKQGDSHE